MDALLLRSRLEMLESGSSGCDGEAAVTKHHLWSPSRGGGKEIGGEGRRQGGGWVWHQHRAAVHAASRVPALGRGVNCSFKRQCSILIAAPNMFECLTERKSPKTWKRVNWMKRLSPLTALKTAPHFHGMRRLICAID